MLADLRNRNRLPNCIVLAAILLLGTAAYAPGLSGGFAFDDYVNIVQNSALRPDSLSYGTLLSAAMSSDAGPLRRPLASLSFFLNLRLGGIDPFSFKVVNLGIHLLNGWFAFCVLFRIFRHLPHAAGDARMTAAAAALIWTVHPLNLTAVLYIVQRMTSLAATFTLLAILSYLRAREAHLQPRSSTAKGWWLGVVAFGCLGVGAKESALLLPFYLILIEGTVHRFREAPTLRFLAWMIVCTAVACAAVLFGPLEYLERAFRGYPFTAFERFLTELRILVFYLRQILFPDPTEMALLHADWSISKSLFQPWTTSLAALFWAGGIVLSVLLRGRAPVLALGLGWFLVGHLLESTVMPLDLVYEHRNYLPSLGIFALVAQAVSLLTVRHENAGRLLLGGALVVCCAMTGYRAWQWSDPFTLALTEARHNPTSARARYEYGRLTFQHYLDDGSPALLARTRQELRASIDLGQEDFHPLVALANSYVMTRETVPEWVLRDLEAEMREKPPTTRRIDSVYPAVRCQISRVCPRTPALVLRTVGAALANPRLTPRLKSELLETLGVYYSNVLGDVGAARRVLEDAVRASPDNWTYRLRLLEILVVQKDTVAARIAVEQIAPAMDSWTRILEPGLAARYDSLKNKLAMIE